MVKDCVSYLLFIDCCIINYLKPWQLKTAHIYLTVSVGSEFGIAGSPALGFLIG